MEPSLAQEWFEIPSVSILTRGKPRVEPRCNRLKRRGQRFNPHSRKTPSGTRDNPSPTLDTRQFQSSLEENPEWNVFEVEAELVLKFQSSLEENPEWNS